MADREHPKKHSDTGSRKQPLSPQHEGIDPLTEGDKLYPKYDTKAEAEKLRKAEAKSEPTSNEKVEQTVADQKEVDAKDNTPNDLLPKSDEKSTDSEAPKGKTTGSKTSSR